jgi:hypothetical protein
MQSIQLKTRVGPDGILQLNVPVVFNETLSETQIRLAKVRQKYEGRTFQDSVELLREDRQR